MSYRIILKMTKRWFQVFKYSVYLFLCANIFLFLRKEWIAAVHRFPDGYGINQWIEVYPSTIDTASWFLLLMLFELETFIIPNKNLTNRLQWALRISRGLCYTFVLYSFWGYISSYTWLLPFEMTELQNLCDILGQSWMVDTDSFKTISSENCTQLAKGDLFFKYGDQNIFTDQITFRIAIYLAIIGIINSLAWILVVVVLEIDVWLQLQNKFSGWAFKISKFSKNVLYCILLIAAIYWGISGKFLDFWDAFMWIVAFFFIENNLIEWKKETEEEVENSL